MGERRVVLARLSDRRERIEWANLVDDTRWAWERLGYRVHVNTNERRIVITPGEPRA